MAFARSINSSPRPPITASSMKTPKPGACSEVIVGGIESSCHALCSLLDQRQKIAAARKASRTPSNGLETANQKETRQPDSLAVGFVFTLFSQAFEDRHFREFLKKSSTSEDVANLFFQSLSRNSRKALDSYSGLYQNPLTSITTERDSAR